MKKTRFVSILLVIVLTACTYGQERPRVSGSGNVVTKDREAGYFNAVKVSTAIDLYLSQGAKESISVEADDNLHEYIMTEIEDNTLRIYLEANVRNAEKMNVYVTMKEIIEVAATSAGDVIGKTAVRSDELSLKASSAGDITLEVSVKKLECRLSSAGDISVSGKADELDARLSSAGDLDAYDLTTRIADVSTSSAGSAMITVTEKLTARTSSAGSVYFRGDPGEVDGHSSSAGRIIRK